MIVYIEDCLIENFLVTFLCINCSSLLLKKKITKTRKIFASLLGAVLSVLYPLLNLSGIMLIALRICIAILICSVAVAGKTQFLAFFLTFIFFTALYAGLNLLIYYMAYGTLDITDNFPTYILLIILLIVYYFIKSCVLVVKKNMTLSNFVYKIKIINQKKEIFDYAFLDSGNALLDQDSTPIFIINQDLFNKLYKDITPLDIIMKNFKNLQNAHFVTASYASTADKILVFSVENLLIFDKECKNFKNAKLGLVSSNFNKNFNCNMLLNINAFC